MTEYAYDACGNLIQESLDGAAVRRYTYNAANRMTLGKNLETGEETRYDYNALYMRIKNVQTLAGQELSEEFLTKETSYVPDYLSITNNDLMACEKDADAVSTIFGQGHERLMQKTASRKVYFQPDLYGSNLSVSDGQGQSLGYSEWDVWGNVKFHGQGRTPLPEGGGNPCFTSYIPNPVIGKHFAQARFYDPAHGRMLAPDPVKRGLNGYPYCGNDPVNYVDPTGEVASILAGGILGGIMGGTFGFAGSAISQIVGGKEFDVREALGARASGMVVGAVRGALVGSGAGLPVALVSDFTAGTVGSTLEQLITGGKANAGKSIAGGLINAVSGAIYGNNPLGSLKEAFIKGAKAGAATSGINYLSEVFGDQKEDRRSGTLRGSLGLVPFGRTNDPRRGCMARDLFGGMTEGGNDYGYRYQIPRRERTVRKVPERFSLAEFGREIVTGIVMGGLSSAAFYGAGRAVEAVKGSVRNGFEDGVRGRLIPGTEGVVTGGDFTKLGKNMMESMGLPRGTNWRGYQAQHIIPAEMANHPVLQKIGIDLDDASNGLFLRTPADDISAMSRHRGYHSMYNEFVRIQFDEMDFNQSINVLQNQVYNLQQNLKYLQQNGLPLYPSQGATLDLWLRSLRRIQ